MKKETELFKRTDLTIVSLQRMSDAIELLLSKQTEHGRWILERTPSNMHTRTEAKGKESKWITYRALKVLKGYFGM